MSEKVANTPIPDGEKPAKAERFVNLIAGLSDEAFAKIWDNPADAEYDKLDRDRATAALTVDRREVER